jgi:hypothetical protein
MIPDAAAAAAIEAMKDQLLIVLVRRLGGRIEIPCAEIDGTAGLGLALALDPTTRVFTFEVQTIP